MPMKTIYGISFISEKKPNWIQSCQIRKKSKSEYRKNIRKENKNKSKIKNR